MNFNLLCFLLFYLSTLYNFVLWLFYYIEAKNTNYPTLRDKYTLIYFTLLHFCLQTKTLKTRHFLIIYTYILYVLGTGGYYYGGSIKRKKKIYIYSIITFFWINYFIHIKNLEIQKKKRESFFFLVSHLLFDIYIYTYSCKFFYSITYMCLYY